MAEFASKGVANAGLATGIVGTALGVLNGGIGNLFGGVFANGAGAANVCSDNMPVATANANIACIQNQVAQLQSLTKVIVPASSICPPVMPLHNSWTAPTASTTGTTPAA